MITPEIKELITQHITVTIALFAIIDIVGSVPILITIKEKMGGKINPWVATLSAGILMFAFLLGGDVFLKALGIDGHYFAIGGSVVIFLMGLEMVLGRNIFKGSYDAAAGNIAPIAFPLIAGSGTLTTIISLKSAYSQWSILIGILINLVVVYFALKSLNWIQRTLGPAGMAALHNFFGVILIAMAVKLFVKNAAMLG